MRIPAALARVPCYSPRSAEIGSTRNARNAGTRLAMNAVPIITPAVAANDTMSSGRHRIELRLDESAKTSSRQPAGDHANQRERHALADDQADQLSAARAERGAHADLARALTDPVREQAVDADDREHQRRGGEHAGQPRQEAARGQLLRDQLVQLLNGEDGQTRFAAAHDVGTKAC